MCRTEQWLAIAWFSHRRFVSMTDALGIRRVVFQTRAKKPLRGLVLAARTFALLLRHRPKVLIVQNPSLVSTVVAALVQPIFRYTLVVDAHNEAVEPYNFDVPLIRKLAIWLMRRADCTIVTNAALADVVHNAGGKPFILFDPLPNPPMLTRPLTPNPSAVVISTYALDEPLEEVLGAARLLEDSGVTFHVTGRVNEARIAAMGPQPKNVNLTGFLTDENYWSCLSAAWVIIDLTMMPNCLVCGAYEAVAAGVPLILTDDPAGRDLFGAAVVYSANRREAIADAVTKSVANRASLALGTVAIASELRAKWTIKANELVTHINSIALRGSAAVRRER